MTTALLTLGRLPKALDIARALHGAGVRAIGRLMDKIMPGIKARGKKGIELAEKELQLIAPHCHWTGGNWAAMNGLSWNEIQNVPRHIQMLSWVLIHAYLQAKGLT